jgi:hypothetical protein
VVDKRRTAGRPAKVLLSSDNNLEPSHITTARIVGTSPAKVSKARAIIDKAQCVTLLSHLGISFNWQSVEWLKVIF